MGKITKTSAGVYELRQGDLAVSIKSYRKTDGAGFNGWVAAADWDRHLYTDAMPTYGMAVAEAIRMIDNHVKQEG